MNTSGRQVGSPPHLTLLVSVSEFHPRVSNLLLAQRGRRWQDISAIYAHLAHRL